MRTSLAIVALVGIRATAFATTPADGCTATKVAAAGKFAECRAKAGATYLRNGDLARRDSRYARCALLLDLAFTKAGLRHGAGCPVPGAASSVGDFLRTCFDVTNTGLASGAGPTVAAFCGSGTTYDAGTGSCVGPVCGDRLRQASENCDGSDLGGASCANLGFAGGALGCTVECAFDVAGCWVPTITTTTSSTTTTTIVAPEGTVIDPTTGLMWELKRDLDNVQNYSNLHDADNRYPWCANLGGNACVVPTNPPDGEAFMIFIAGLNTQPCFAGFCDWRLPTIEELQTLLEAARPGCNVGAATCSDPLVDPTSRGSYWSSSSQLYSSTAQLVDFTDGHVFSNSKAIYFYVRAVRGGP